MKSNTPTKPIGQMRVEVERTAEILLRRNPSPVVRYRLLRDVLRVPQSDRERNNALANLDASSWVQHLASEQQADGGWGGFHSQITRAKKKIATTEAAVERALALGLQHDHPILSKTANYIVAIMRGRIPFPDRAEKNDRWQTGMRLFLASTLALIQPEHPMLESDRATWLDIARWTFRSGRYDLKDEIQAHKELTGASVQGSYLRLRGRYQINLLGSAPGMVSSRLENEWLSWLWSLPDGIGYLSEPLAQLPPNRKACHFDRWLASHELLARSFPTWGNFAQDAINWLWAQRNSSGLWDFGLRPAYLAYMPISDSWRKHQDRVNDWTTRILVLVRESINQILS